jgi:hypothetical protein
MIVMKALTRLLMITMLAKYVFVIAKSADIRVDIMLRPSKLIKSPLLYSLKLELAIMIAWVYSKGLIIPRST